MNKLNRYTVRPAVSSAGGYSISSILAESPEAAIKQVKERHRKLYGISGVSMWTVELESKNERK